MKIVTVIGARPQFIKAAALSRKLKETGKIEEVIIHTGQHYDTNMSDIFFSEMEIPKPDYNLAINGSSHGAMTGEMLKEIEKVLQEEKPDYTLVYGDTNSTLAGALAAVKLHIPIVHIEAGLRSFNNEMPEEINRILTDRISSILLCPTDTAIENLKAEGFDNLDVNVEKSGDIMLDAALFYKDRSNRESNIIGDLNLDPGNYVLTTIHRAENTDSEENLRSIVRALEEVHKTVEVVVPLHPRTRKIMENLNIVPAFKIIDPVGYLDMISLISNSKMVMTDSGGLQKEAYFFEKFCITLREQTEWTELVTNGYNQVVGTDYESILKAFEDFSNREFNSGTELYGSGNTAGYIQDVLLKKQ